MSKRAREVAQKKDPPGGPDLPGLVVQLTAQAPSDVTRCAREEFLKHQLRKLEVISLASIEQQPGAAVAAVREGTTHRSQLDELRALKRARRKPATAAAHKAEILAETRRARLAATAAASFTAIGTFMKLELDQVDAALQREEEARKAQLEHLEETDIVAMLAESLRALPESVRARVLEQVSGAVH